MIFTGTVSSSTRRVESGHVPGLGMNASKGVEESVRDLIMLLPMAEMAVGSCEIKSAMIGIRSNSRRKWNVRIVDVAREQ